MSQIVIILILTISNISLAQDTQRPAAPEFVGSTQCTECHKEISKAWGESDHGLAWTSPTSDHVLGDFDNASFSHKGITSRFFNDSGQYFIETDSPLGKLKRYAVKGVVGIKPLQQYLLETEPGKLQAFDVVWDTLTKRWYHLYPEQHLTAKDGLHWTGVYKSWNARCAECHATRFTKGYDPLKKSYHSSQSEIGVGCESCHGPSQAHLEWAKSPEQYIANKWGDLTPHGLVFSFERKSSASEIQVCAACHSRREAFFADTPPTGTKFDDAYQLSLLREGLYHADGQIQGEVYVLGSFMQSKMYAKGVRCSNCHEVHSTKLKATDNSLCTQCHWKNGNTNFPSLPKKVYDSRAHHFHEAGSKSAQCINCHMPQSTFMVTDERADHSFPVPRPDLSVKIGTPNACTNCHVDKAASWAKEILVKWYPDSKHRGPHFGEVFHKASQSPAENIEALFEISENLELPAIVRASALDLMVPVSTPKVADQSAKYLEDPDPLVRAAAVVTQRGATQTHKIQRLTPMSSDPSRSVRIAVAKEMLELFLTQPKSSLPKSLKSATQEWRESLQAKADFPETQTILGGMGLRAGSLVSALLAFEEATRQDPQLVDAWIMIVRIHLTGGDIESAKSAVQSAIDANPNNATLKNINKQISQ